ncbi:glycosyltransferase family 61 protein [Anabaena sphaerica FACHB-251]|uniref:Glycosyltransferase family 61 protein n=1 Tax=Anabaena sphaerica FACHB-251 TaxID=2692883 RepID=A0A926WHL0_9NOST|nr:glycosyltransferase family 61 protein [Anabaena sphaerica]MBD2294642.1 glycosyltransferase family 61 protein [Anabaena sphaerica FACHB-251]
MKKNQFSQLSLMEILKLIKTLKNSIQKYLRVMLVHETTLNDDCKSTKKYISSEIVATPETKDMPIYSYAMKGDIFSLPNIFTTNLYQVIYYARYNSLFTWKRELIVDSVMGHIRLDKYSLRALYFKRPEKISGVSSVFRSVFSANNYYHTLIDHLPRLYLIDQPDYKEIEEIKLLVPDKLTNIEQYFLDKILPENVKIKVVEIDKLYMIENLIFPSFLSHKNSGYLPSNYLNYFWSKVLPKRPRNKINRIYISRKLSDKSSQRCVLNEDELIEKLQHYGFKKYSLEDMSVDEQIELFYDAICVIAPHGAGLTNIIFSEKINVIEMFPASGILPHFYYLSKSLEHSYRYWCGKAGDKDANFKADIKEVLEILGSLVSE